uniref:Uncharacterized protein n=1 Tax=Zea mays TaxID=4577 RepID=A0A804R3L2_MAIZE
MGHHHISRSYFRQTDIKRSGNASIDIMSKFFKLMVVLQLMNDLNRSVQDAAISCIEAYSVLEVLRPLYNSPKILEQKSTNALLQSSSSSAPMSASQPSSTDSR